MYNHYQGNSGRVRRIPDTPQPEIRPKAAPPAGRGSSPLSAAPHPAGRPKPPPAKAGGGLNDLVGGLMQKLSLQDLEMEDLLLILILYLMYRESGDKELLVILGSLFLL